MSTRSTTNPARSATVGGGALVVAVAIFLYSRFELYSTMIRDSSIYLYGGQQVLHGLPPYASEMDPKGPISSILASFGVAVARLFDRDQVIVTRLEFCAIAILGVLGVYLLVLELWQSVVGAVAAAVAFTAFRNFAFNALVGTDGHMPGFVFMIFALWLTARRSWYLAGVTAALAFLTWQPLAFYPILTVICAVVWSSGSRLRALRVTIAGIATPVVALIVYYGVTGHLRNLLDGLLVYPLTGVVRPPKTIGERLHFLARDVRELYGDGAILFWGGLILVLVAAVWKVVAARSQWRSALGSPIVLLITLSMLYQAAYVCYDYIGYPHSWPLLPYAATGWGLAVAHGLRRLSQPTVRRVATGALAIGLAAIVVAAAINYAKPRKSDTGLRAEQAGACALQRSLVPKTPLWVINDPRPLVLLHRRQPDNFPYVGGGLDIWKVDHTAGGFAGWTGQIRKSKASIVVFDTWLSGKYKQPMAKWLRTHGYLPGYIGGYAVYVTPKARAHMRATGIELTTKLNEYPLRSNGKRYAVTDCVSS